MVTDAKKKQPKVSSYNCVFGSFMNFDRIWQHFLTARKWIFFFERLGESSNQVTRWPVNLPHFFTSCPPNLLLQHPLIFLRDQFWVFGGPPAAKLYANLKGFFPPSIMYWKARDSRQAETRRPPIKNLEAQNEFIDCAKARVVLVGGVLRLEKSLQPIFFSIIGTLLAFVPFFRK